MSYVRGMGQSTTAPFACPAGYTFTNPDNAAVPPNPSASQLAQLQGAFCVNPSGDFYMGAQGIPITVAWIGAAVAAAVFLPGLLKILAAIPAYGAYQIYRCNNSGNNASGCVVGL